MTHTLNGSTPGPLRVLLVDDHEDTNRMLALLLKRRGYEVRAATSIAEALRVAGEETLDVLVSDLGLPDGSGLDLLERLPAKPTLGGIMVSGHSSDEDLQRSRIAGYAKHLVKPVSVDKLDAAIKALRSDAMN